MNLTLTETLPPVLVLWIACLGIAIVHTQFHPLGVIGMLATFASIILIFSLIIGILGNLLAYDHR